MRFTARTKEWRVLDQKDLFGSGLDGIQRSALLELAAQGPVHHLPVPGGRSGWLVTGFAEGRATLTDPRVRKSPGKMPYADVLPVETAALHTSMLNANPPDHTRLRRLVSSAFSPRRIAQLDTTIAELCSDLIDPMVTRLNDGATVDVVADFAFPLPFQVICGLLGVPGDRADELGRRFLPLSVGRFSAPDKYAEAATAMVALLKKLVEEKRQMPGRDVFSALVSARDGDDQLSDDELTSMAFLLLLAGHETTTGMIGNGLLALLRHPEQLALLRAEPERMAAAVEEMLRYDGSVRTTVSAFAAEPLEIAGVPIAEGDLIMVSLQAAGIDPLRSEDVNRFDITRPLAHTSFGHGIHHCLGAPLARLELRLAFTMLLERLPEFELADDTEALTRLGAVVFNRTTTLPIRRKRTSTVTA